MLEMKAYNYLHGDDIIAVELRYNDKVRCFYSKEWMIKVANKEFGDKVVLGRADFGRETLDESVADTLCRAYIDEWRLTEVDVEVFTRFIDTLAEVRVSTD